MITLTDLRGSTKQRNRETLMRNLFRAAALTTMLISALIVFVLFRGAINFLQLIDWDLGILSDNGWFPRRERFDLRTIIWGSVMMGAVAMLVAVPLGLGVAVYLSEYAPTRVRRIVKPVIEVLGRCAERDHRLLRDQVRRPGDRVPDLRPDQHEQHVGRWAGNRRAGRSDHGVDQRGRPGIGATGVA